MIKMAVTVDTEADRQWTAGVPLTTHNIAYCARFQDLCHRYGVVPTYLVTSEVAEDDNASELLDGWRQAGAEIGAHLHPWTTSPYAPRAGLRYNDPVHAYPSQLPDELLFDKTMNLTEQLTARFGTRPTSYRAGRFGFDQRGARILAAAGYQVDSSVTPLTSWAAHPGLDGAGGPNFRCYAASPFRIDVGDRGRLTELPVTIVTPHRLLQRFPQLLSAYRSLPVRAVRKLLAGRPHPQPMWASPLWHYTPKNLMDACRCAERDGLETIVMMFHSSELMPGGSPFWPDRQAVRRLFMLLEAFFSVLRRQGAEFPSLTALSEGLDLGSLPVRSLENGESSSGQLLDARLRRLADAHDGPLGAGGVIGHQDGREETASRRMTAV